MIILLKTFIISTRLLARANAHIVEVVDSDTVHENIVGGMYVEALLDLCIRCYKNMGPCCDEYKSIGQAHDNWQERPCLCTNLNKPGFPHPTHRHLLLSAVMGCLSTAATMRILPTSLLLLLLSPVGLAGKKTSNYTYLPQVSLPIRNSTSLTRKQGPECSFGHVTTS